jgi:anthranilate/para-aminobenzoate synthase component II
MATKQMIVAICLMVAVLLPEVGGAIQKTPKISRAKFAQHKKVGEVPKAKIGVYNKAENPDADLTTVRVFHFIMNTKQEILAVELHAFKNSKTSAHESLLTLRTAMLFNSA